MVEGGMKCVKYLLFAFNLIFFVAGLALIIAGAVVMTSLKVYLAVLGDIFNAGAILLIVVGAVVFIIGFFGCCGAYKENYCMVMTFAVLLGLVFILEIAAGITAYIMRDQVKSMMSDQLYSNIGDYGKADFEAVTVAWDEMQQRFHCCGVNGTEDWKTWSDQKKPPPQDVPTSCCVDKDACPNHSGAEIYDQGCLNGGFVNWVKNNIFIIGGVGIGLAFVQVFGIIIACCMAQSIRKEYQVV